jgi:calpain-15
MDDKFPCKSETSGPLFSKGNDNELWVLILEKAYAKAYGTY